MSDNNLDKLHSLGCQSMKYIIQLLHITELNASSNNKTKSDFTQELGDKLNIILLRKYGASL